MLRSRVLKFATFDIGTEVILKLRMLSSNEHKIKEATEILLAQGVEVVAVNQKIDEIQTDDSRKLVHDKALKAFKALGRSLFVEHTGLHLPYLGGLPAGLTQVFWDKLGPDKFGTLFGTTSDTTATAVTVVGYCDSLTVQYFEGRVEGSIVPVPRGPRDFQWDCVFVPKGETLTFAEMGHKKQAISMRRIALDAFVRFLSGKP